MCGRNVGVCKRRVRDGDEGGRIRTRSSSSSGSPLERLARRFGLGGGREEELSRAEECECTLPSSARSPPPSEGAGLTGRELGWLGGRPLVLLSRLRTDSIRVFSNVLLSARFLASTHAVLLR